MNKGYYTEFPEYTPRPGGAEYRTISIETEAGLKQAEDLKAAGWAIAQSSPWRIGFWRPKNEQERP